MRAENVFPAAVTYHRVSTVDQDPTLARAELRRAVALRELALIEEIEETASGSRTDRPGLNRVLELARAGRISHVAVWKLDRFGRSMADTVRNIEALTSAGVTFVATSQLIELGPRAGAIGKWQANLFLAFAELERDLIHERTMLGLAGAKERGVRLGRPPKWIDPAELAAKRAAGWSIRRLAQALGVDRWTVRQRLGVGENPPEKTAPPDHAGGGVLPAA